MKKIIFAGLLLISLSACAWFSGYEEPPYNYIAAHVRVVEKASNFVVYEYANIRVDEVAPVAAIYCHDQGGRQASLYDISLRPDNRRRAVFVCK